MHIMVQWVQGPRFFISNNLQMIPEDLSLSGKDWDCPNPSHIFAVWPRPPCYCWSTQHKHLTQNKLIWALLQDVFEPELGKKITVSLAAKLCIARLKTSVCPFFLLKGESLWDDGANRPRDGQKPGYIHVPSFSSSIEPELYGQPHLCNTMWNVPNILLYINIYD